jgi:hypothetical protein
VSGYTERGKHPAAHAHGVTAHSLRLIVKHPGRDTAGTSTAFTSGKLSEKRAAKHCCPYHAEERVHSKLQSFIDLRVVASPRILELWTQIKECVANENAIFAPVRLRKIDHRFGALNRVDGKS